MPPDGDRIVLLLPYLDLRSEFRFGRWLLGSVDAFEDRWPSDAFRRHVLAFLAAFHDSSGAPIRHPSVLVRTGRHGGAAFTRMPRDLKALQQAITFAALAGNPRPSRQRRFGSVVTTDNTQIHGFTLNPERRWAAYRRGSMMLSTLSGGWQIGEDFVLPQPLDVSLHTLPRIEEDILAGAYKVTSGAVDSVDARLAGRIRAAIDWLSQAWQNTPAIRPADRVVMLKTGFESLTGQSDNWEGAKKLRRLFETLTAKGEWSITQREARELGLLWSPRERERHTIRFDGRRPDVIATRLQHWFVSFGRTRNRVVHDGEIPDLRYPARRSPYSGHFVWTAEWLLRNGVLIAMEQLGLEDLWRSDTYRIIKRTIGSR
jgi:hypothetical protein